jgi:hypothetical protein
LHICTSAHLHICTSAHLHICTSAHLHICTSAHQQISKSANQQISKSANQQISKLANQQIITLVTFVHMEKITPILGWIGFGFGILTSIAAFLPHWGAPVAFICMLPGFLFSSVYVLLSTKYQIISKGINPGYMGMLLNSTPLILIAYFQLTK